MWLRHYGRSLQSGLYSSGQKSRDHRLTPWQIQRGALAALSSGHIHMATISLSNSTRIVLGCPQENLHLSYSLSFQVILSTYSDGRSRNESTSVSVINLTRSTHGYKRCSPMIETQLLEDQRYHSEKEYQLWLSTTLSRILNSRTKLMVFWLRVLVFKNIDLWCVTTPNSNFRPLLSSLEPPSFFHSLLRGASCRITSNAKQ